MSIIYTPKPVGKSAKAGKHITYVMNAAQKLAQKENFALFVLASMRSNLCHVREVCSRTEVATLYNHISSLELAIKNEQLQRKAIRKQQKATRGKSK